MLLFCLFDVTRGHLGTGVVTSTTRRRHDDVVDAAQGARSPLSRESKYPSKVFHRYSSVFFVFVIGTLEQY